MQDKRNYEKYDHRCLDFLLEDEDRVDYEKRQAFHLLTRSFVIDDSITKGLIMISSAM
jgi:hypothetical protein